MVPTTSETISTQISILNYSPKLCVWIPLGLLRSQVLLRCRCSRWWISSELISLKWDKNIYHLILQGSILHQKGKECPLLWRTVVIQSMDMIGDATSKVHQKLFLKHVHIIWTKMVKKLIYKTKWNQTFYKLSETMLMEH